MSFSFGFGGDDIEPEEMDADERIETPADTAQSSTDSSTLISAHTLDVEDMLKTLPSSISYNMLSLEMPSSTSLSTLHIPRREVFDIRAQLMAESDADHNDNDELLSGLEKGDITPAVYEGGFKTWECALDLAKLVVGEESGAFQEADVDVVELGAGTSIPSLAIFQTLLSMTAEPAQPSKKYNLTLADYNASVLRLVTLPNLLLTWSLHPSVQSQLPSQPEDAAEQTQQSATDESPDLDITPDLIQRFISDIAYRGIVISLVAGSWSSEFVQLALPSSSSPSSSLLVLASETIYSPAYMHLFTSTLLELLRKKAGESKALVAAKRVYFGVGGGIEEFRHVVAEMGGKDVGERVDVKDGGVGRVVVEVRS